MKQPLRLIPKRKKLIQDAMVKLVKAIAPLAIAHRLQPANADKLLVLDHVSQNSAPIRNCFQSEGSIGSSLWHSARCLRMSSALRRRNTQKADSFRCSEISK